MDTNILTIVVEIKDREAANPIWDAMKESNKLILGCRPFALAWGDMNEERDKYAALAKQAMRDHQFDTDRDLPETVEVEGGKKFHQWPFGVYSASETYFENDEWFVSLDDLKEKYKVVREDGEAPIGT